MKRLMILFAAAAITWILIFPSGVLPASAQDSAEISEITSEHTDPDADTDQAESMDESVTDDAAENAGDITGDNGDNNENTDGKSADDGPADEEPWQYEEWQTEDDEYDTEGTDIIQFILSGTDKLHVAFNSDFSAKEEDIVYDEIITDGDERQLQHGSTVRIKGISGYLIYAAFGETEQEAVNNPDPEISEPGQPVSIGQDGTGYIYIKIAESREDLIGDRNVNTAVVSDDDEGSILYSDITNEQADRGDSQDAFPSEGQVFTGKATLKDYTLKTHNSIGYLVPENGWLRNNTAMKSIAAVCISGPTKAMANKGASFNYIVRILEADPVSGKVRVGITFKPRSNKNNVSWGTVNNYHAGTQVLYKAMYIKLHPRTGYVTLLKCQSAAGADYSESFPSNYTLAGAVYRLYTDSSCISQAEDVNGSPVEFRTHSDGSTDSFEVVPGTYYAREITASRGHRLDHSVIAVNVTADNTASSPAVIRSEEVPVYSDLRLKLIKTSDEFGYRRLIGTRYELSYYDTDTENPVLSSSTLKGRWVFTAKTVKDDNGITAAGIDFGTDDADGREFITENGRRVLPLGVFTVRETEAPKGLAVDKTVYMGKVRQNGDTAEIRVDGKDRLTIVFDDRAVHEEDYKSVVIMIRKKDAETGLPYAEGADRKYSAGSLEGAVYEVFREDTDLDKDVRAGEIITDSSGFGMLEADSNGDRLKPGRYYIREVKASPGYVTDNFSEMEVHNRYEDGRHILIARADLSSEVNVYDYEISSMEMHHETYISKTDAATGAELPGARLILINTDGNTVEEWVSGNEPHLIKALPDGKYTLREITAPYGYDIAEDIEFEMTAGSVTERIEMKNRPLTIGTEATDEITGSHIGTNSEHEVITDYVKLTGLYPGRIYRISGRMVDRDTGNQLMKNEFEPAVAETEFTADSENMTVEMKFAVDSSEFENGKSAVVFEKLFRISSVYETAEELPIELQKHENLQDEGQTIYYGTTPASEKSGRKAGPKTGDGREITVYIISALVSAAALAAALMVRRKMNQR